MAKRVCAEWSMRYKIGHLQNNEIHKVMPQTQTEKNSFLMSGLNFEANT